MIVAEPRTRPLNGTTQARPHLERAVRKYMRAYARQHGRRETAEDLGVSHHTLWRFLERGHTGRAVPQAVLNNVGDSVKAIQAATFEIIIDLEAAARSWRCVPCTRVLRSRSCWCAPRPWPRWKRWPASRGSQHPRSKTG